MFTYLIIYLHIKNKDKISAFLKLKTFNKVFG